MFNWYIFLLILIVALLLLICILLLITRRKKKNLLPTRDKDISPSSLNNKLISTGFYYSEKDDIFYSRTDAWQRDFGYCHLYDEAMPLLGMIVDCEPISFDYNNKHWLIEFRKGQYGMSSGGEIGIYNTTNEQMKAPGFHGIFYETISDEECIPLAFVLRKNKKVLIHQRSSQWWLAGLKLAEFSNTATLSLDIKIVFPNTKMRDAFVAGLVNVGYTNREFFVYFHMVVVHFTKPHTLQPASRTRVHEAIIQQGNESNCELYEHLTSNYNNTLDKLEFLANSSPELYDKFMKSFHSKELYHSFELISPILKKFVIANQSIKIDDPLTDSFDL